MALYWHDGICEIVDEEDLAFDAELPPVEPGTEPVEALPGGLAPALQEAPPVEPEGTLDEEEYDAFLRQWRAEQDGRSHYDVGA